MKMFQYQKVVCTSLAFLFCSVLMAENKYNILLNRYGVDNWYLAEWNSLGITTSGINFEIGLYLKDGNATRPINFWVGKKDKKLLEVDSFSSINRVLTDISEEMSKTEAIHKIIHYLTTSDLSDRGRSGLPLYIAKHPPGLLQHIVNSLLNAGLDRETADLLLRLGGETEISLDENLGTWKATWYEVDKLGAIERNTVHGTLSPLNVKNCLREMAYEANTVRSDLLDRKFFFPQTQ